MLRTLILILLIILSSCNRITPGSSLSSSDIKRIEKLGLLDKGETIIKFYSELDNETAGNLVTDRRLASYWMDRMMRQKQRFHQPGTRTSKALIPFTTPGLPTALT